MKIVSGGGESEMGLKKKCGRLFKNATFQIGGTTFISDNKITQI